MRIDINVDGLDRAVRKMKKWTETQKEQVKEVVAESAYTIEAQAIALAPVSEIDGGNLKNSMSVQFSNDGLTADIGNSANYAQWIEFGTGKYVEGGRQTPWVYFDEKLDRFVLTEGMPAQPFLFPAYESEKQTYVRNMNNIFRR